MCRRWSAFVVLILCLILCSNAFAGGAGNCIRPVKKTSPHYGGIAGAFDYNYVNERMNELENKRGPKDMKVDKISQIYGKVIIGLGDYTNLYGKAGSANYDLEFIDRAQDAKMEIDLEDGIYTGAGINAHFPMAKMKSCEFGVGFDIQANFSWNDVKGITRSSQSGTNPDGSFYAVDGQNSIYLTCKYDIEMIKSSILPYVGAYHSWMVVGTAEGLTYTTTAAGYVDKEHYQASFDFTSFGILVGVDVDVAKYINLNVEGRFVGETAITTGATIKF